VLGAVTIYSRDLAGYGEEHIRLLETISRIAADAIGKSLQHDQAQTHALTDPMTSLPNARSLQIQFDKEVARTSRSGTKFQLLMLDLDGFKFVNDSFGHRIGDEVLKGISKVIKAQLRDYDFLARYGGDEFVALIPETSAEDVIDLCDRIERAVSEFSLRVDENKFAFVGVSLGASSYPIHGESFDQLIVAADKAMYNRKTSRKQLPGHPSQKDKKEAESLKAVNADNIHVEAEIVLEDAIALEGGHEESFIVEVDESHVVSSTLH
jgi:diguanylate cyclase (GGDEF)-like protein